MGRSDPASPELRLGRLHLAVTSLQLNVRELTEKVTVMHELLLALADTQSSLLNLLSDEPEGGPELPDGGVESLDGD